MAITDTRPRLDPQELAEQGPAEAVRLPVELVDANPANPRRELAEVEALADSIGDPAFGLLQPILVRRMGERYQVLAGHRRLAAFRVLLERAPFDERWKTIPAVVRRMDDDDQAYLALLLAQVQIRPWTTREEAHALEVLAVDHTLREIGDLLHRGETWASRRLRVYADAVLSAYVQTGRLALTVAEELLLARDTAVRKELADQAAAEQWNQQRARAAVRALKFGKVIRDVRKRSRELLDALSAVDPSQLPPGTAGDLWALHNRIEVLARGGKPVFPTIEDARRAAGISDSPRTNWRAKAPKRRMMPPPA